jgi:hypothetical protein
MRRSSVAQVWRHARCRLVNKMVRGAYCGKAEMYCTQHKEFVREIPIS